MGLSVDRKRALSPEQQKLFDSGLALAKQRTRWWSYVCRGDFHEVYSWALVGLSRSQVSRVKDRGLKMMREALGAK